MKVYKDSCAEALKENWPDFVDDAVTVQKIEF